MDLAITNTEFVTESFTDMELTMLKQMVLGYGKFKKTALRIGIKETTLRSVIQRGYGRPETIAKIRTALVG
jgi:hypothetical protein